MKLGQHEASELHELGMFKTNCIAKSSMMQALVNDSQLSQLMQSEVKTARRHLQEIQGFLTQNQGGMTQ
ncbi:hypothetical protein GCM10007416_21870 [Kroppenstedtia guangzhouensis]|jgi:similar to spore coat protein|uniref:Spore coat protein n=1 Tax=Kroppenstedtia guangzhouensis TaxID=1274356 RepID=A0ABQ1GQX3_9BACL|nr:spore coat protein [Kroppenstedtia guangzhouensis]GGA48301.1 hypothetical protein GCM10007416_21870 [Kroppenstedtia guangzhouensis]